MSTYPSLSDQIFRDPETQPKVFALCDVTIMGRSLGLLVLPAVSADPMALYL